MIETVGKVIRIKAVCVVLHSLSMISKNLNSSRMGKWLTAHLLSTYAKFSEKLTFLTPLISTHTCAYRGVRNVSFSENFAYVLNGWPL